MGVRRVVMGEDVLAVVLAGGLARRMGGGDKPLLRLGGETLLERVLSRIGSEAGEVVLNANGDISRFARFGLEVISDGVAGRVGPLAGVLAGMEYALSDGEGEYRYILSVPGDAPFLPVDLLERLGDSMIEGVEIVMAASERRHPVVGLWRLDLAVDLRRALEGGLRKITDFTDRYSCEVVSWDFSIYDPFMNLNTREDLEIAQSLL